MIRRIALLCVVASVAVLAACGTSTTGATGGNSSSTVEMGSFNFASGTSITIKAGQAVTFDDPSATGGTHVLVTGTQGQFSAQAGAPSEFSSANGIMFNPGDSKTITFPTAGTYTITCSIHSSMLATITVTP